MKHSLAVFLLLFTSAICHAQYTIDLNELAFRTGHSSREWTGSPDDPYVEGSPFLEYYWSKGMMILVNDTMLRDLEYRYCIYTKQMQLRVAKDTMILQYPEKVKMMIFNNRTFIYTSFLKEDFGGKDYFQLITDGKCRFLLRREVEFFPKNPPLTPISGGYEYDRFILHESVYLQKSGSLAVFMKPNKKNVMGYLEDHQAELEQYIKANKTRFSDQVSLAKLIDYYNSLN